MIETSPDEVLALILKLIEKHSCTVLDEIPLRIHNFFMETLSYWTELLSDIAAINSVPDLLPKLAVLWGVIRCYPSFECTGRSPLLFRNLIGIFDQLLESNAGMLCFWLLIICFGTFPVDLTLFEFSLDNIASVPMLIWQDLLGATLNSYHKLLLHESSGPSEAYKFLHIAKRHKLSPRILSAVAEYLDSVLWCNTYYFVSFSFTFFEY